MLLVKLIEPPCTERYARWCERSEFLNQEKFLLLDFAVYPEIFAETVPTDFFLLVIRNHEFGATYFSLFL